MKALDILGVGLASLCALVYMGLRLARALGSRKAGETRAGSCASCPAAKGRGGRGGGCPGCG